MYSLACLDFALLRSLVVFRFRIDAQFFPSQVMPVVKDHAMKAATKLVMKAAPKLKARAATKTTTKAMCAHFDACVHLASRYFELYSCVLFCRL